MFNMSQDMILITGASGQLGTVLTEKLQEKFGVNNVIATDLRDNPNFIGTFEKLDATDFEAIKEIVPKYNITQIYHLAAILSANGEKYPLTTWDINMKTFFNILQTLTNVKYKHAVADKSASLHTSVNIDPSPPLYISCTLYLYASLIVGGNHCVASKLSPKPSASAAMAFFVKFSFDAPIVRQI